MDSLQIESVIKNKRFIGVFPRDKLPKDIEDTFSALIVNTDSSSEKGEHWIAIIIFPNHTGEYFDSFGLPPLH